jgi:hypothetical protein
MKTGQVKKQKQLKDQIAMKDSLVILTTLKMKKFGKVGNAAMYGFYENR